MLIETPPILTAPLQSESRQAELTAEPPLAAGLSQELVSETREDQSLHLILPDDSLSDSLASAGLLQPAEPDVSDPAAQKDPLQTTYLLRDEEDQPDFEQDKPAQSWQPEPADPGQNEPNPDEPVSDPFKTVNETGNSPSDPADFQNDPDSNGVKDPQPDHPADEPDTQNPDVLDFVTTPEPDNPPVLRPIQAQPKKLLPSFTLQNALPKEKLDAIKTEQPDPQVQAVPEVMEPAVKPEAPKPQIPDPEQPAAEMQKPDPSGVPVQKPVTPAVQNQKPASAAVLSPSPVSGTSQTYGQLAAASPATADLTFSQPLQSAQNLAAPVMESQFPAAKVVQPAILPEPKADPAASLSRPHHLPLIQQALQKDLQENQTSKTTRRMAAADISQASLQVGSRKVQPGKTLFLQNPESLQVDPGGGSLQSMQIVSKTTKKSYPDLQSGMQAEKDSVFEVEATIENPASQKESHTWTIVPAGESLAAKISMPAQSVSSFYSLSSEGTLQGYQQKQSSSPLLCRGYQPLKNQKVTPGEMLRIYVPDGQSEYEMKINGKVRRQKTKSDGLGQSYLPLKMSGSSLDVEVAREGKTLYAGSVKAANPYVSAGLLGPGLGTAAGLLLEIRRKKRA